MNGLSNNSIRQWTIAILFAWFCVLPSVAWAQVVCRGDVDGDGIVTADDLTPLLEVIFDPEAFTNATFARADANADGTVGAADAVGILILGGTVCAPVPGSPTPTRTRTPTPTLGTPAATFTPTLTRTPTSTGIPTPACFSQPLPFGPSPGSLTGTDCQRTFRQEVRRADEFTLVGQVGQAIRIAVDASGFEPWVRVVDGNGFFDLAEGRPPVELRLTSNLPYTVLVASAPGTESQLGSYQLSVTQRACETQPMRTTIATLDGSECPDPSSPSFDGNVELADVYTFDVTVPLTLISITMRQSIEDSQIDPAIAVYGPKGYEVFPSFQTDDQAAGGFGFDAFARFVAVETGTYTVVATGAGCVPQDDDACGYRILFGTTQCPRTALGPIPDTVRQARAGTHYGNPLRTRCAAPVPLPGFDDLGVPEVGSPADIYTFSAQAGDVITVEMESEDEGQVYLFGPADAGNPMVAADGDSNGDLFARVGVTLTRAGTYTIVAANKSYLFPPDPEDPEDEGELVEYTLYLQKCPVRSAINAGPASVRNDTFSAIDCVNASEAPVRSYAITLDAGTFLDATMEAGLDAYLTLLLPDGRRFSNDDDRFGDGSTNSRVNHLAPLTGTYFLEATASPEAFVAGPLNFTLRPRTCVPTLTGTGLIDGALSDADCDLGDGRRYDVIAFDAPVDAAANPRIASLAARDDVCVLPILPTESSRFPVTCGRSAIDVPIAATGRHAWMIAGAVPASRGAYALDFTQCSSTVMTFGSAQSAFLQASDCADALGDVADWFVFRADKGLTRFAEGFEGQLAATFTPRFSVAGADGALPLGGNFFVDLESFYESGENSLTVLKLAGASGADQGGYTLSIEVPLRRQ